MPCWRHGVERNTPGDARDEAATGQKDAGRRHRATSARGHLDIGGWGLGGAVDCDRLRRHWGTRAAYQFRLAFIDCSDDVSAVWQYAHAAGSGQVAAQSPPGARPRYEEELTKDFPLRRNLPWRFTVGTTRQKVLLCFCLT